jgi:hypothetical protein
MREARRLVLGGAIVALALVLADAPALAYVRTVTDSGKTVYWRNPCPQLIFFLGDPPPVLGADEYLVAAQRAAAAWSAGALGCTDVQLTVASSAEATACVGADGSNRIVFRRDVWCRQPPSSDPVASSCYDARALAITSVFSSTKDGRIMSADIELNAVNFTWGDLEARADGGAGNARGVADVQNTLTHEFGHVLGFDHPCYEGSGPRGVDGSGAPVVDCAAASERIAKATMYPLIERGETRLRTLEADDIDAVCQTYPYTGATCRPDTGDRGGGGCAYAASAGRGWLSFLLPLAGILVAILGLSSRLRARWLTSTSSPCRTCGGSIRRTKRS